MKKDKLKRSPKSATQPQRKSALGVLKRKLRNLVHTDNDALFRASFDGMKLSFMPDALIRIKEEAQVGEVLKLANRHSVPVTVRGAASTLTGAAAPVRGGWVMDLTALKHIKIDALSGMANVGAGAIVGDIQSAAEKKGWFYPPDPSSSRFCTIGGNIACNAGGLRGAKYGVTRDYVLSLEGYLPTGERVAFARPLRKWAVGYNMRDLWIGSEGMLGVITSASLRLIPKPELRSTFLLAFAKEEQALKAVKALMQARVVPVALEFLDSTCIRGLEEATGEVVFNDYPGASLLLLEIDGSQSELLKQKRWLRTWAKAHADTYKEAKSQAQSEQLWDVRRQCSPAMYALGDSKLNEDVIVPIRSQLKLIRTIRKLRKESGLHIPTFGHAADGNFHVNIMYYRDDKDQCRRAELAVKELMREVVAMGGAISGEHGIGLAKTHFLREQYGEAEIGAMKRVKEALDPNGILNPGKLFEPFSVWKHAPVKVKLPWDKNRNLEK